ncbi:MAG: isopentenyl-diphosphate Delta-isomerase [Marinobacter adhaerens]
MTKNIQSPIVSFEDEPLILVDHYDQVVGHASKAACHEGSGILHRAFSVFVFNRQNEVLLQKRSQFKPLWPAFWSNSCCSHPRRGEGDLQAAERRLQEELSVQCVPQFLYRFRYKAYYEDIGTEHELCSVYAARWDGPVAVNSNEVEDWFFISPQSLDRQIDEQPDRFTPWLKLEWQRIRGEYWSTITGMA